MTKGKRKRCFFEENQSGGGSQRGVEPVDRVYLVGEVLLKIKLTKC